MTMTFEEARDTAAKLLQQRGQLLNGHLLKVVHGDKELFRQVRESLLASGWAYDNAGLALDFNESEFDLQAGSKEAVGTGAPLSESESSEDSTESDIEWWVMASGQRKGPFSLGTLRQMQQRGEICPSDVVRRGTSGPWLQQAEVLRHAIRLEDRPRMAAISDDRSPIAQVNQGRRAASLRGDPLQATASGHPQGSGQSPAVADPSQVAQSYFPPEKLWSQEAHRPSWILQGWRSVAQIFGGTRRFLQLMAAACLVFAVVYWWKQPPPATTVYREFQDCFTTLQKMRERRTGRTDWGPTVNRFRPRVEGIVSRLQFRSSPAEKELYQAGHHGLIPLLAIPADPTNAERVFEKHMSAARHLIDQSTTAP